ncbi:hypothetical protein NITLEN_90130 [Nitrospira lenta]|uniref:Uncharacterized protein n=1 Tax=Nitrospira lenta TaxID=1436998 RepID=A0A330LAK0_9BACT|nr:hypothetical protein NITLEN_90130 [Nitrospira lenta]
MAYSLRRRHRTGMERHLCKSGPDEEIARGFRAGVRVAFGGDGTGYGLPSYRAGARIIA